VHSWTDGGASCVVRFSDRRHAEAAIGAQKAWGFSADWHDEEEPPPNKEQKGQRPQASPGFRSRMPLAGGDVAAGPSPAGAYQEAAPPSPATEAMESDLDDDELLELLNTPENPTEVTATEVTATEVSAPEASAPEMSAPEVMVEATASAPVDPATDTAVSSTSVPAANDPVEGATAAPEIGGLTEELTAEPTAELTAEPTAELTAEPTVEPTVEPTTADPMAALAAELEAEQADEVPEDTEAELAAERRKMAAALGAADAS